MGSRRVLSDGTVVVYKDWSVAEHQLVLDGYQQGMDDLQISELLGYHGYRRESSAVRIKRHREGIGVEPKPSNNRQYPALTEEMEHNRRLAGDAAFKRAMLAAIKRGEESAVIGVVKNDKPLKSPWCPFRAGGIVPTQSVAGELADMGNGGW
jgi:hypothetical protein